MYRRNFTRSLSAKPTTSSESLANFSLIDSLSSTRSTASSPWIVGMIETRKSISRFLYRTRKRPSCGTRFSAMSSSLMTLMREMMVDCQSFAIGGMA